MLRVKEIYIYPIKGLKGIRKKTVQVLKEGFQNDRRWMLIDASNSFISQRSHSELALFETYIDGDTISVYYKTDHISFFTSEIMGNSMTSHVWDSEAHFYEVAPDISKWFSKNLGSDVRLVKQDPHKNRIKRYSNREGETAVSLADGYPILILGTGSMELLNSKLSNEVSIDRFRANVIVETTVAHEEDKWGKINIGSSQIEIIKPCARCQVINIDQSTADSSKEVLKTLSTYRKEENKVYFGANAAVNKEGEISEGEMVY